MAQHFRAPTCLSDGRAQLTQGVFSWYDHAAAVWRTRGLAPVVGRPHFSTHAIVLDLPRLRRTCTGAERIDVPMIGERMGEGVRTQAIVRFVAP